jgi:hypothetical protein
MRKKHRNKVANEALQQYKWHCIYYLKRYGLTNYQVHFAITDDEVRGQMRAATDDSRLATIMIGREFAESRPPDGELQRVAFHEVHELLLHELITLAKFRYTTEHDIDAAKHEIIRRAENAHFGLNVETHTERE